ncbi:hypothetical protein GCM10010245_00090 [Streptomyces spectabilis]|nr:hypothetical protein GCM10010245_00090 [Streptomyces spectabilis]
MTSLKVDGKPGAAAAAALEPHVGKLFARPGMRLVGIIEPAHVERTHPAPDSDKTASVKVKITQLEIPSEEQEGAVRGGRADRAVRGDTATDQRPAARHRIGSVEGRPPALGRLRPSRRPESGPAFHTGAAWTGWHTSSVEWTPGKVRYYLDGLLIGASATGIPAPPLPWVLQNESALHGPYAAPGSSAQLDITWMIRSTGGVAVATLDELVRGLLDRYGDNARPGPGLLARLDGIGPSQCRGRQPRRGGRPPRRHVALHGPDSAGAT